MGCSVNVPVAFDIRDSGWLIFPSPDLTTLAQWEPVDDIVLEAIGMVEEKTQAFEIIQVQIKEVASSAANIKKNSINVYFFTDAAPTTPVEGVVYNPSITNALGVVPIIVADYVRHNDTTWVATSNLIRYCRSGVLSTASSLYIAAVFSGASPLQYGPGAGLEVRVFTRLEQNTK